MEACVDDLPTFVEPDVAFHGAILRASGNAFLGSLANLLGAAMHLTLTLSGSSTSARQGALAYHRDVAHLIAARDGEGAAAAMTRLLENAAGNLGRALQVERAAAINRRSSGGVLGPLPPGGAKVAGARGGRSARRRR
jgi:DNA-binding FadR family transcriptional regulator